MLRKHFVFNDELWNSGLFVNVDYSDGKLFFSNDEKAFYVSPPLDSGEKNSSWGRMKLDFDILGDANVIIHYIAYNDENITAFGENINLSQIIEDFQVSDTEKLEIIQNVFQKKIKNSDDIILSDAEGQFFRFAIEVTLTENSSVTINAIDIQFPLDSIIKYLPAVFSENKENADFLKRFLGVYQSLIYDLQENIDNISRYFDVEYAKDDFLEWLASWVGINFTYMWSEEKLRELVKKSFYYYKLKGTKRGLKEVISFYTKHEPIIIETDRLMNIYDENTYKEYYKQLYGDDIYSFYIFIQQTDVNYNDIEKLVEMYKPAHTTAKIIFLDQYMVLGKHSYIGINSKLMGKIVPTIGKGAMLPFNSILIE